MASNGGAASNRAMSEAALRFSTRVVDAVSVMLRGTMNKGAHMVCPSDMANALALLHAYRIGVDKRVRSSGIADAPRGADVADGSALPG